MGAARLLKFSGFVLAGIGGANQGVGTSLDGGREFLEIFGDVAEIIEELVDIFGVDVERLIQVRGEIGHVRESGTKLSDGLAGDGAVLAEEGIDVSDGFGGFGVGVLVT